MVRRFPFRALVFLIVIVSFRPGVADETSQHRLPDAPPLTPSGALTAGSFTSQGSCSGPSRMTIRLMASRYCDLLQTQDGYTLTGIPLLAYDGKRFLPAGFSDDPGIYYLVPLAARRLKVPIEQGVAALLLFAIIMSVALGVSGFIYLLKSLVSRLAAIVALAVLTALAYHVGDVYVVEFATCAAVLPWLLYFIHQKSHARIFPVFLFTVGAVLGLAAVIRSSSAFPILAISVVLLVLYIPASVRQKTVLIAFVLLGFSVPRLYLYQLLRTRDAFLKRNVVGYIPGYNRHVLGHFAYAGMGFLSNPYVSAVSDEVGKNRVRAVCPNCEFLSSEYDRILLRETALLAIQHPYLAVCTILAKLGVIAGIIILFANVGIVAAVCYPKSWKVEFAFWAGLAISAAPLLLFAPNQQYIVGLMSLSATYGLVSLDHGLKEMKSCPRTKGRRTLDGQRVTPIRREVERSACEITGVGTF